MKPIVVPQSEIDMADQVRQALKNNTPFILITVRPDKKRRIMALATAEDAPCEVTTPKLIQ